MTAIPTFLRACALLLAASLTSGALAERADRDKPVNLEADKVTVDDARKTQVFEGNVELSQGTLIIRTARLVVTQDAEGFQKGVAYGGAGGLARFRQKRENKDDYIDGEAERIEYDAKADKAEFFVRAHITSGLDEVRGPYISYNGKTENYLVSGTPGSTTGRGERVHAVIQPKSKEGGQAATASPPLRGEGPLTPAPAPVDPRQTR